MPESNRRFTWLKLAVAAIAGTTLAFAFIARLPSEPRNDIRREHQHDLIFHLAEFDLHGGPYLER